MKRENYCYMHYLYHGWC